MTLESKIEAMLFVADAPIPMAEIARITGAEDEEIRVALENLRRDCEANRGIQLIPIAGGYQFSTKPEYAPMLAEFLKPARQRLGRSQLEVLAIVAYRQPVTAAEIEAIRGVSSDSSIRALLDRRLIAELGRKQTPGRPNLYGTSDEFLHQFKLHSIEELPPLDLPILGEGSNPESESETVESPSVS